MCPKNIKACQCEKVQDGQSFRIYFFILFYFIFYFIYFFIYLFFFIFIYLFFCVCVHKTEETCHGIYFLVFLLPH